MNSDSMGLITYLKETKAELRHVSWPTQKQTINFTVLVIAISLVTGLVLGLMDYLFLGAIKNLF
ncbi:MAG TPA: preprotein translocase subunit SecE [Candidatus Paceibacterota bacterium]|nr:preprotein translocase subunit SecE [Candidatus Paceibacterota bacterium]